MAYYDRIAKQWHKATGFQGGAFKRHVLNERIIEKVVAVDGRDILELGAGNGYFLPLMLRRFSGQVPGRVVVTDHSKALLDVAQRHFRIDGAEYLPLDARGRYPFPPGSFDLILATMVFNELSTAGLRRALGECRRVLRGSGTLIATVTHPDFVQSLSRRGELKKRARGMLTMPAASGLRLPVFPRSVEQYQDLLSTCGFESDREDVFPTEQVLREKPGLRYAGVVPVAIVFACTARAAEDQASG